MWRAQPSLPSRTLRGSEADARPGRDAGTEGSSRTNGKVRPDRPGGHLTVVLDRVRPKEDEPWTCST